MDGSSRKDRRRKRNGAIDEPTIRPPSKNMKTEADCLTSDHQNDVIDVSDDEAERHSDVSSVKREEEPVRSAEFLLRQELITVKRHSLDLEHKLLNFEQQVAMKDGMLKRERRATHEAELRADRAEKLLGSKRGLGDEQKDKEWKEKVADLRKKLEKTEEQANKREADLTNQLEEEKVRSNEKVADLRKKLEKTEEQANKREADLTNQLEEEKVRSDEKVMKLKNQIEKEREEAREKMDRLKNKLSDFRISSKALQVTAAGAADATNSMIHTIAHDHNILFLLNSTAYNSMPIDVAVEKVRTEFEKCGEEAKERFQKKSARYADCSVCDVKTPTKLAVTTHFLSEEHIEKVRSHDASVSKLAVNSWAQALFHIQRDSMKQ